MEIQRGIDPTVWSLVNQQVELINKPEEICEAFQEHFIRVFRYDGGLDSRRDLTPSHTHTGLPGLSERLVEWCNVPVMIEAMADVAEIKRRDEMAYSMYSPYTRLVRTPTGYYVHELATDRINSKICSLFRKSSSKGDCMDNFQPITLPNTKLKISANVLAKGWRAYVGWFDQGDTNM